MLCDEVGLGKTIEAGLALRALRMSGYVGRALIAHVCERARAMGCAKVHWHTHETNAQAMALYDKVAERPGFVQYRIGL